MTRPSSSQALAAMERQPLFSSLGKGQLRSLIDSCEVLELPAGSEIVAPGEIADRFFVIVDGKVKIFKLSSKGDEQTLHLYGSGQTFGEAAMWAGIDFPAHAATLSQTSLVVVSRATLKAIIARTPESALAMLAGMSAKLREFNLLIEQLSLKEVPARLARALLDLSREAGSERFRLEQSKRELAAQIGTIAETLSRALKKLRTQGLIDVDGAAITILDAEALARVAEG